MNEPRPLASLSSSLLARKGAARPAMRPHHHSPAENLGWNDRGTDKSYPEVLRQQDRLAVQIEGDKPDARRVDTDQAEARPVVLPVLKDLESQKAKTKPAAQYIRDVSAEKKTVESAKNSSLQDVKPRRETAAFTLRLDPERHLRLRLACAVENRSAQQFVIEALDKLLNSVPELDELVDQLPSRASGKR